ncbi:DJ-1/PfpI family protein [Pseudoflavonifractor phocaeensis]|uniref:DJ-1 family glyoxalase III n=1 Tax=Pseudoflavonifractor phocaeensis TaxID=1870988 RepID=UPI00195BB041|nr:DJ-1 family glyoxalase III [Pseudoflavonifractor phocaeensis]MBM6871596.1 DJ-1/PfpI family protein [Pseudoflavonifractor phocaeensis]MBM6939519.1 DJ-1/PfpI family protein [Pseudoflavonifractor phocaeensis]
MVAILLATGFEESEALVPADLLRRAGVEVKLVGLDRMQVTGSHGITVSADCTLAQLDQNAVRMLFLPGGLKGVENIQDSPAALAFIETACTRGVYLAAICAAPTILARVGILDRRNAVCYPGMEEEMGSAVVDQSSPVVEDGHIITGQAAGSSFPFGLKLVEILKGRQTAEQVAHGVHYHGSF